MKTEIQTKLLRKLDFRVSNSEIGMRTTPHGYIEISAMVNPDDFPKKNLKWAELIPESKYNIGSIYAAVNTMAKNINEEYHRNLRVLKDLELPPRR